jgi:hypothetical protein
MMRDPNCAPPIPHEFNLWHIGAYQEKVAMQWVTEITIIMLGCITLPWWQKGDQSPNPHNLFAVVPRHGCRRLETCLFATAFNLSAYVAWICKFYGAIEIF